MMNRFCLIVFVLLLGFNFDLSAQGVESLIKIQLKKEVFTDDFFLLLHEGAKDNADVYDALKISDGYVSIAGFQPGQLRLSIDARPFPQQQQQVDLIVKGYTAGTYTLIIKPMKGENLPVGMVLVDRLSGKEMEVGSTPLQYDFHLDSLVQDETAQHRFTLLVNKIDALPEAKINSADLLVFPNPFEEMIHLNVKENATDEVHIRILDLQGKVCLETKFMRVMKNEVLDIPCGKLLPGIYLLEWKSRSASAKAKTLKIIKI